MILNSRPSYISHADSKILPAGLTKKLSDFARMTILIVQIGDEITGHSDSNFIYMDIVKACKSIVLTDQIVHAPVSVSPTGTTISGMENLIMKMKLIVFPNKIRG